MELPRTDSTGSIKNSVLYKEFLAEREEILCHKWIESEKAGYDIGFERGLWPRPEQARKEVYAAKTLGLNMIQFHRDLGKAEALDADDKGGLMRYMEPGGGNSRSPIKGTI